MKAKTGIDIEDRVEKLKNEVRERHIKIDEIIAHIINEINAGVTPFTSNDVVLLCLSSSGTRSKETIMSDFREITGSMCSDDNFMSGPARPLSSIIKEAWGEALNLNNIKLTEYPEIMRKIMKQMDLEVKETEEYRIPSKVRLKNMAEKLANSSEEEIIKYIEDNFKI